MDLHLSHLMMHLMISLMVDTIVHLMVNIGWAKIAKIEKGEIAVTNGHTATHLSMDITPPDRVSGLKNIHKIHEALKVISSYLTTFNVQNNL